MRIVMKFGGSSLATAEHIRRAARLVADQRRQGDQVAVVVSAQGDTTDRLLLQAQELSPRPAPREMDMLLACGEQLSMALLAIRLEAIDCPAMSFCGWQAGILTGDSHGRAPILSVEPQRVLQALEEGRVAVVAGFQGVTAGAEITTIGRGGSDTTAVALADALGADVCRIYTDVRGVCSADPRVVEQAQVYREISYDEMLAMAHLGARVLHSRAVELAREKRVRVEVRSTFAPEDAGTALCPAEQEEPAVRGITCDEPITMLTVFGIGSGNETCRLFELLDKSGVSVDVIIRSAGGEKGRVGFSVSGADGDRTAALLREHQQALGFSGLLVQTELAKVSVIGSMSGCAVAAKMLRALEGGGIGPQYITTGALRASVIVRQEQARQAVRLLHESFFGEGASNNKATL